QPARPSSSSNGEHGAQTARSDPRALTDGVIAGANGTTCRFPWLKLFECRTMNDTRKFDAECLRPPEHVCEPDPRTKGFVTWDANGTCRRLEVSDYHASVSRLKLNEGVPERVAIQFETIKNLYVYSW